MCDEVQDKKGKKGPRAISRHTANILSQNIKKTTKTLPG